MSSRQHGGGDFILGLIAGSIVGAGLGLLFAPRRGEEVRALLSERGRELGSALEERYGFGTGTADRAQGTTPGEGRTGAEAADTHGSGGGPFS